MLQTAIVRSADLRQLPKSLIFSVRKNSYYVTVRVFIKYLITLAYLLRTKRLRAYSL